MGDKEKDLSYEILIQLLKVSVAQRDLFRG